MADSVPPVLYEKQNQVTYITLNRSEVLNALNQEWKVKVR